LAWQCGWPPPFAIILDYRSAQPGSDFPGPVGRAPIEHHHIAGIAPRLLDDWAQRAFFVLRRDHGGHIRVGQQGELQRATVASMKSRHAQKDKQVFRLRVGKRLRLIDQRQTHDRHIGGRDLGVRLRAYSPRSLPDSRQGFEQADI
jgi:hypothetical protein